MKNYTILKTGAPNVFTLENEDGKVVADVRGKNEANVFAHVPELLEFLDACLLEPVFPHYEAVNLHEKLRPFIK